MYLLQQILQCVKKKKKIQSKTLGLPKDLL